MNCENMLAIVKKINDEKADEEDIIFENLEIMEFTSLSSLRGFCYGNQTFIFPSLLRFIVQGCPQIEIFSSGVTIAPYLTEIELGGEEGTIPWKGTPTI
ncbi:Rpp4 candidate [Trifolium pratense]|uniref:Rpp4 candidate n=1 Tax=Trifolium pratense TaxID=57577 RepID=A0A2K3LSK0_TRIPR|nr:Rpp4 candidate [Trifolium pratense]